MQTQLSTKELYLRHITPEPIDTPEALFDAARKEHRGSAQLRGLADGLWTGWCIGAGETNDDDEISAAMTRLSLLAVGRQALETMSNPESFDEFRAWFDADVVGADYHLAKLFGAECVLEVQAAIHAEERRLQKEQKTRNALQSSKPVS